MGEMPEQKKKRRVPTWLVVVSFVVLPLFIAYNVAMAVLQIAPVAVSPVGAAGIGFVTWAGFVALLWYLKRRDERASP